ncbi:MAG: diaminopimelate epimerase [Candidatus Competibacter sp.]
MRYVPFYKYTNCGNSFVIVDELSQSYLAEVEKPLFAKQASDVNFGVGSDGLLVIQPLNNETLSEINNEFNYWDKLPPLASSKYIFRLFESNMKEALACGNGLLCVISYLYEHYGIESANIMTEIPLHQPNNITISFQPEIKLCCCNLGYPRRLPKEVASGDGIEHYKEQVDIVYDLKIGFRSHDLHSFAEDTPLLLSGYLTFTGEPHLVIFPDECMPPELSNTLFIFHEANQTEKRRNFGSWLVNHIGAYINKHFRHRFPLGINVSFACIHNNTSTIQYRTYERGVDRETLACGTGAAAIAYIAKVLGMTADVKGVSLLPTLANRHEPDASLVVTMTESGILLNGLPSFLFDGRFKYK